MIKAQEAVDPKELHQIRIIEAYDRHLLGNDDPPTAQFIDDRCGNDIVIADNCGTGLNRPIQNTIDTAFIARHKIFLVIYAVPADIVFIHFQPAIMQAVYIAHVSLNALHFIEAEKARDVGMSGLNQMASHVKGNLFIIPDDRIRFYIAVARSEERR